MSKRFALAPFQPQPDIQAPCLTGRLTIVLSQSSMLPPNRRGFRRRPPLPIRRRPSPPSCPPAAVLSNLCFRRESKAGLRKNGGGRLIILLQPLCHHSLLLRASPLTPRRTPSRRARGARRCRVRGKKWCARGEGLVAESWEWSDQLAAANPFARIFLSLSFFSARHYPHLCATTTRTLALHIGPLSF